MNTVTRNGVSYRAQKKHRIFNDVVTAAHFFFRIKNRKEHLSTTGMFVFHDPAGVINENATFQLRASEHYYSFNSGDSAKLKLFRIFKFCIVFHKTEMPFHDFLDAQIHSRLDVCYLDKEGYGFTKNVKYSFFDFGKGKSKNKRVQVLPQSGTTIYVRQGASNATFITSRRTIPSDNKRNQYLLAVAWMLAKLTWWRKTVLLYEKESMRYEEGASILYESLINEGYNNFYYIIDKDSEQYNLIKEKYRVRLVHKNTLRHYYNFFIANCYIGTELPSHSIDLRVANKRVIRKLSSNNYKFIFLQHGVSYMVSYGSKYRESFRKANGVLPNAQTRIVVNSEVEASHFIDYAGFDMGDMYLTGFPKFDRSYRYDKATKIVIMPTWRPWEYNAIRTNPESTRYYKMLTTILNAVPVDLRKHVQLLPHPLFIRELRNSPLAEYIKDVVSYDEVLRQTDILITDYSSISYDAFYRGAKVIFWWKEKDYCMEKYGGFLMLKESNAFGDIVYTQKSLKESIARQYSKDQDREHIKLYRDIVNFHDGHNTERLIKQLVKDNIIKDESEK